MHVCRDDAEDSTSYEWVREYNYKVHNDEDHHTFWFQFHNDHVSFTDVNTKLALVKRGRQATIQAHQRPSGVRQYKTCPPYDFSAKRFWGPTVSKLVTC